MPIEYGVYYQLSITPELCYKKKIIHDGIKYLKKNLEKKKKTWIPDSWKIVTQYPDPNGGIINYYRIFITVKAKDWKSY